MTTEEKQHVLWLYEKGVISERTLSDNFGVDWEEEKKRKKEEFEGFVKSKLLTHSSSDSRDDMERKSNRIEQARRNVEALTKLFNSADNSENGSNFAKKIMESIMGYLPIMDKVKDL